MTEFKVNLDGHLVSVQRYSGSSTWTKAPKWSGPEQAPEHLEGVCLCFRDNNNQLLEIFIEKHDAAQLAKTFKEARKFWKRFRLPKMIEQKARI